MSDINLLYSQARDAREKGDKENSYKLYKEINKADPNNWEAKFYITYFDAMKASMKDFWSISIAVLNLEREIFDVIKKNINEKEEASAIEQVCKGLKEISKKFTHDTKLSFARADQSVRDESVSEYVSTLSVAAEMLYSCGDDITEKFGDKYCLLANSVWKQAIEINSSYVKYVIKREGHFATINKYVNKIQEKEKDYVAPEIRIPSDNGSSVTSKIRRLFKKFK